MSKEVKFVERLIKLTNEGKVTWQFKGPDDEYICNDNGVDVIYDGFDTIVLEGKEGFQSTIELETGELINALDNALREYAGRLKATTLDLDTLFVDESDEDSVKKEVTDDENPAIILKLHPGLYKLFDSLVIENMANVRGFMPSWSYFNSAAVGPTVFINITIDPFAKFFIWYDYKKSTFVTGLANTNLNGAFEFKHIMRLADISDISSTFIIQTAANIRASRAVINTGVPATSPVQGYFPPAPPTFNPQIRPAWTDSMTHNRSIPPVQEEKASYEVDSNFNPFEPWMTRSNTSSEETVHKEGRWS